MQNFPNHNQRVVWNKRGGQNFTSHDARSGWLALTFLIGNRRNMCEAPLPKFKLERSYTSKNVQFLNNFSANNKWGVRIKDVLSGIFQNINKNGGRLFSILH